MRFDDLAKERITLVDIEQALKDESPYLLFYQILPIEDSYDNMGPSSAESENFKETESGATPQRLISSPTEINKVTTGEGDQGVKLSRPSLEITVPDTSKTVDPTTRRSVAYSDTTLNEDDISKLRPSTSTTGTTPVDEDNRGSFSLSRRGSKARKRGSKTRTESQASESRKNSSTTSRVAERMSREKLNTRNTEVNAEDDSAARDEKDEKPKQLKKRDRSKGKGKQKRKSGTLRRSDKPDRECAVM
jgi:hypothetical protein